MSPAPTSDAETLQSALSAWQSGRFEPALESLQTLVLTGHPQAMYLALHLTGLPDVPSDLAERPRRWIAEAAPSPARNRHHAFLAAAHGDGADKALRMRLTDFLDHQDAGAGLELGLLALLLGETALADKAFALTARYGSGHAIAARLRRSAQTGMRPAGMLEQGEALARAGHPLAGTLVSSISSLPETEEEEISATDLAALGDLDLARLGTGIPADSLSDAPRLTRFAGALPAVACDYLASGAAPLLQPAQIFDPQTGQTRADPYRTSLTATLSDGAMDLALWGIKTVMARLSGCEFAQGEPLSVLVYRPGEEYRAHFDFMVEDGARASADLAARGQRTATSLVRLNDGFSGGATAFPRLDVKWDQGLIGDAFSFDNVDANGQPDKRTLHSGEPVTAGMKILASLWLRERA